MQTTDIVENTQYTPNELTLSDTDIGDGIWYAEDAEDADDAEDEDADDADDEDAEDQDADEPPVATKQTDIPESQRNPLEYGMSGEELIEFIKNYRYGHPSVKILRQHQNKYYLSKMGPLPRMESFPLERVKQWEPSTDGFAPTTEIGFAKYVFDLLGDTVPQCALEDEESMKDGFSKIHGAIYTVHWDGSKPIGCTRIHHPALENLSAGYYVDTGKTPKQRSPVKGKSTETELANKLVSMGFESLLKIPLQSYNMRYDAYTRVLSHDLRTATFKADRLLGILSVAAKAKDMFGYIWPNSVRVGDSFYQAEYLYRLVKSLAKLDDSIMFHITPAESSDKSKRLYITTKYSTTVLSSFKAHDSETHFVLVTNVPEGITSDKRLLLVDLESHAYKKGQYFKEELDKLDRTLNSVDAYKTEIAELGARLHAHYDHLIGCTATTNYSHDDGDQQQDYIDLLMGRKNASTASIESALAKPTAEAQALIMRVRDYIKQGFELAFDISEHLDAFRPKHQVIDGDVADDNLSSRAINQAWTSM